MAEKETSFLEGAYSRLLTVIRENRVPLLATVIAGLLAHMYVITNKLPNYDDVKYIFAKGATIDSGRWGLVLLQKIIPNYSMPWLHGIVSILLLAVAVCVIVRVFEIRGALPQTLLAALIICFPSQIGTFAYMFTSSCYAVAFLLAVLAVQQARKGGLWGNMLFLLLYILSLSIYQAYISLTASLLLLLVIKDILDVGGEDRSAAILKTGLRYLLLLVLGAVVYRLSIALVLRLCQVRPNEYTNEALYMAPGVLEGLKQAYRMFFYNLTSRYNMLIVSKLSRALHFVCILLCALGLGSALIRARQPRNAALMLLCLILLPLSICCLYVIIFWSRLHTLVLYGYVSLYVLVFLCLPHIPRKLRGWGRDLVYAALTLVAVINIIYANRSYLKLQLQYENAYSLVTSVVTQIRSLPGYDEHYKIAFYKTAGAFMRSPEELDENIPDIAGLGYLLNGAPFDVNTSGQSDPYFLQYFIGANMPYASEEEILALAKDSRTQDMPLYPNDGSIRIIDDFVYVKFSDWPD